MRFLVPAGVSSTRVCLGTCESRGGLAAWNDDIASTSSAVRVAHTAATHCVCRVESEGTGGLYVFNRCRTLSSAVSQRFLQMLPIVLTALSQPADNVRVVAVSALQVRLWFSTGASFTNSSCCDLRVGFPRVPSCTRRSRWMSWRRTCPLLFPSSSSSRAKGALPFVVETDCFALKYRQIRAQATIRADALECLTRFTTLPFHQVTLFGGVSAT
jgi:hypothetical protein